VRFAVAGLDQVPRMKNSVERCNRQGADRQKRRTPQDRGGTFNPMGWAAMTYQ